MEKELKTKALKIIKNYNSQELNKETYNTIISLANNSLSKKAQEQINKILKLQTRKGELETKDKKTNTTTISSPIKLLQTITIYIKNNKNKKTIKKYIKSIKKTINYLEKNLDTTYLLIHDSSKNKKTFKAIENAILISYIDELSDILNEFEYTTLADTLFMLKGKIELGFNRYFTKFITSKQTNNILIKEFQENGTFTIATTKETIKILKHYNFDNKYLKKICAQTKKELKTYNNSKDVINYLILLKKIDKKQYQTELKRYKKILENFPKKTINTKKYKLYLEISKSLNSKFKEETKELKTQKQTLIEPNNIKTANSILELINK